MVSRISAFVTVFVAVYAVGFAQNQPMPAAPKPTPCSEPTRGPAAAGPTQCSSPVAVKIPYDSHELTKPSPLSDRELNGRRLFTQKCGVCHDPLGQSPRVVGPFLSQDTFRTYTDAAVRQKILNGSVKMPGFKYMFSEADADDVAAFLRTVKASDKPAGNRGPSDNAEEAGRQ
jgi:mono/diheme cytochrome c family protein